MKRVVAALVALLGTGCVSFSNMQRADVLEEGHVRVGFAPIAVGQSRRDITPQLPFVASVRYGLGHDAEVAARFWLIGASAGGKYQFVKTPKFVASVAPEILAYSFIDSGGGYDVALPVLGGVNFGRHQLIFGPRLVERWWSLLRTGSAPLQAQTLPGAVLGFDLATAGGFHVMPEVNYSWWVAGKESFWTATLGFYVDP